MVDSIPGFSSPLKIHDKKLNETVKKSTKTIDTSDPFKSLNIDQLGLSEETKGKVFFAKAQFEVNYQVLKVMNASQGFETPDVKFSFNGSFEFLQKASGGEAIDETQTEKTDSKDSLSRLQDFFSPENTAKRIVDVALSFFTHSSMFTEGGDNEESRQKFVDFIGNAIEQGFGSARDLLKSLPDKVNDTINKTHSLVFDGLKNFVINGLPTADTEEGSLIDKITAYRTEAMQNALEMKKSYSSSTSYDTSGQIQDNTTQTSNILTSG